MKKSLCLFGLILAIISIVGCSTTTPTGCPSNQVWFRPNTTAEETQHDLALCQYDAISTRRATSVYGDTVGQTILLKMVADSSEDSKENQMIASCMTAKGYTLIKKNSLSTKAPTTTSPANKVPPELEAKIVGRWESISFKTKVADKDQNAVDRLMFVFFPNQRVLNETIYKNGKTEPRLNHYYVDGDNMVMIDPFVASPYTKTTAKYSLIDDQMILTADNVQMILHKVSETNAVPEIDNLLLGQWLCNLQTNSITSVIKFKIMPQNRYNFQMSVTSTNKNVNENEDGIYCYDAEKLAIVSWSDKDSEPEWFKYYIVGNQLNLVEKKVTLKFSKEAE